MKRSDVHKRWNKFSKHFSIIDEKDSVTTESFRNIIEIYKEYGVDKIYVRHMYISGKARLTSFVINTVGNLERVLVWRDPGGQAWWDPELIKLINRPKKRRKRKVKPVVKPKVKKQETVSVKKKTKRNVVACKKHNKYTAARSPRTDCKACWKFYYHKHPEKK